MKCRDLMKLDPEWISSAATALDAAQIMRDRSTSFLLVSDPTPRRLRGIVTDRDLAVRVCAEKKLPQAMAVMEIATVEIAMCYGTDDVEVAEKKMRETERSWLIVVDEAQGVIGVLSLFDILRRASRDRAMNAARADLKAEANGSPAPSERIELTPSTREDEDAVARQPSIMMGATRSDSMKVFPS